MRRSGTPINLAQGSCHNYVRTRVLIWTTGRLSVGGLSISISRVPRGDSDVTALDRKERTIFASKASFARDSRGDDHRCGQKIGSAMRTFVEVLIEHHAPRSREDTNWAIKGVRLEGPLATSAAQPWPVSSIKCRARLNFVRIRMVRRNDYPADSRRRICFQRTAPARLTKARNWPPTPTELHRLP